MRKTGLVLAIMVLLAGVSVQAQKKSPRPAQSVPSASIMVQADEGEGVLVIDPLSGAFNCNLCEYGFQFDGKGTVKIDGCVISYSAVETNYRIYATIDMCGHQAKVVTQVIDDRITGIAPKWISESFVDSDMQDNSGECGKQ
ncbi:MAG: hypothetical protein ACRD2L_09085 [Terriglobia bacterium]